MDVSYSLPNIRIKGLDKNLLDCIINVFAAAWFIKIYKKKGDVKLTEFSKSLGDAKFLPVRTN